MNNSNSKRKRVISVSCSIIINQKKILILKRKHKGPRNRLWEFPGGKQEAESPIDCAIRETLEEIHYEIEDIFYFCETKKAYLDINIRLTAFLCFSSNKFIPNLEVHDEFKWIKSSEFKQYEFPSANLEIIDILIRNGY
ncbi:NUDIX domain-containing protein [bacterium]|jgi:mutator protein MutT|nr:NUDIX domain-containing protein [bacterium]MBT3849682.1 NUDIX domain-containing protein [bacterium]MBT4435274.1 NUDIX domain-containing protein [bacterium]MDG2445404.1 NUDIX domain-containing protein [Thermodesulfobacteriota bacterium]NSX00146.1 NUDIX domain-containing protein [bacterium]